MHGLSGALNMDATVRQRSQPSLFVKRLDRRLQLVAEFSSFRWHDRGPLQAFPSKPVKSTDGSRHLRVTSIMDTPFVMLRRSTKRLSGNDRFEGYVVDLVQHLAERLHFNYTIEMVKDGAYGGEVNGRWNGMVGEVMRGVADLAVAPMTITYERETVSSPDGAIRLENVVY